MIVFLQENTETNDSAKLKSMLNQLTEILVATVDGINTTQHQMKGKHKLSILKYFEMIVSITDAFNAKFDDHASKLSKVDAILQKYNAIENQIETIKAGQQQIKGTDHDNS